MSTLKNFRYVARTLSGGALLAGLLTGMVLNVVMPALTRITARLQL